MEHGAHKKDQKHDHYPGFLTEGNAIELALTQWEVYPSAQWSSSVTSMPGEEEIVDATGTQNPWDLPSGKNNSHTRSRMLHS